jgi:hypothetical protein
MSQQLAPGGKGAFDWVTDPNRRSALLRLQKRCPYQFIGKKEGGDRDPISNEPYDHMDYVTLDREILRMSSGYCYPGAAAQGQLKDKQPPVDFLGRKPLTGDDVNQIGAFKPDTSWRDLHTSHLAPLQSEGSKLGKQLGQLAGLLPGGGDQPPAGPAGHRIGELQLTLTVSNARLAVRGLGEKELQLTNDPAGWQQLMQQAKRLLLHGGGGDRANSNRDRDRNGAARRGSPLTLRAQPGSGKVVMVDYSYGQEDALHPLVALPDNRAGWKLLECLQLVASALRTRDQAGHFLRLFRMQGGLNWQGDTKKLSDAAIKYSKLVYAASLAVQGTPPRGPAAPLPPRGASTPLGSGVVAALARGFLH